jgi:O-antigen/teichoic acid export membrane protein
MAWNFTTFFSIGNADPVAATMAVGILASVFALNFPGSLPNAILAGVRRQNVAYGCQIVSTMIAGTAVLVTVKAGGGLLAVVIAQASGSILGWTLQLLSVRRLGYRFRLLPPVVRSSKTAELYRIGGANVVISISQLIGFGMDNVIIARVIGTAAVTQFQIGRYLAVHAANFVASLSMTLAPVFTQHAAREDHDAIRRLYIDSSRMLLALFALIATGILIFGKSFILLWMGEKYLRGDWWQRSDSVLSLMTAALLVRSPSLVAVQYLLGTRQLAFLTKMRMAEAVINLSVSIFLARTFGIAGVALSRLMIGVMGGAVFIVPYALRRMGLPLSTALPQIVLPAAVVGGVTAACGAALRSISEPLAWRVFFGEVTITGAIGGAVLFFVGLSAEKRREYGRMMRFSRMKNL